MKHLYLIVFLIVLVSGCVLNIQQDHDFRPITYSDGGKACNSSLECEGNCILRFNDNSSPSCEYSNDTIGCFSIIEDYPAGMCVD